MPTDNMRSGDFSGLVNTNSGWLPRDVANQFRAIAPSAVVPASDSAIYMNYNVANGNQFTPATTAVPFPGNKIPQSLLDPTALKAAPMIAKAGDYYLNSVGLISNIYSPRILLQNEVRYTTRIDHIISDTNRLYGRYSLTPVLKTQGTPVSPTNNAAVYSAGQQAMIADTHTFSPTLINDLRINYSMADSAIPRLRKPTPTAVRT